MDKHELVKRCQNGDPEAIDELYRTYSKHLMGVIRHYVNDITASKDIFHDGFLIIIEKIGTLRDPGGIESWMSTIMKNLSLLYINGEDLTLYFFRGGDVPDVSDEQELEKTITMDEIEAMIQRLPDGYQRVFRLAVLEHKSHKEISELLGISEGTSGSQLYHAVREMRKMIEAHWRKLGLILLALVMVLGFLKVSRHDPSPESIVAATDVQTQSTASDTNAQSSTLANTTAPNVDIVQPAIIQILDTVDSGNISVAAVDTLSIIPNIEGEVFIACDTTHYIQGIDSLRVPSLPSLDLFTDNFLDDINNKAYWQQSGFTISVGGNLLSCLDNRNRNFTSSGSLNGGSVSSAPNNKTIHNIPVSIVIGISKPMSSTLSVESGMQYTMLQTKIATSIEHKRIQVQYIGLPLKLRVSLMKNKQFSLYGTTGAIIEFPVYGKVKTWTTKSEVTETYTPPIQWSISLGAGIEYHLTPHIGIFAEPSVNYYFKAFTPYPTIRQDHPCEISIPIGLRYNWP